MELQVGRNRMKSNNWNHRQVVTKAFGDDYDDKDEYHTYKCCNPLHLIKKYYLINFFFQ